MYFNAKLRQNNEDIIVNSDLIQYIKKKTYTTSEIHFARYSIDISEPSFDEISKIIAGKNKILNE